MDEVMMKNLVKELHELRRQYGKLDDMNRITITKQKDHAVMASVRKLSFQLDSTFEIDDRKILDRVTSLVESQGVVWIVPDSSELSYELYVPPSSVL